MDFFRVLAIRESSHRIVNPLTPEKVTVLGQAVHLRPGQSILDLASGKGEMLATWARDHAITGTGVDINAASVEAARARAAELGVADRVGFIHGDASAYVADEPVDVAMCIGATWIGGGTTGTIDLLERSLRPGGLMMVGEIYWRIEPPDEETARIVISPNPHEVRSLPGLVEAIHDHGWDLVEMIMADQDSWDRYVAPHWFNIRAWLDANAKPNPDANPDADPNPDDELIEYLRDELRTDPVRYTRYQREYLGWGVFALKKR